MRAAAWWCTPLFGLAIIFATGCSESRAHDVGKKPSLQIGDPAPAAFGVEEGADILLGWVLKASDCLTCEAGTLAREIRGLQRTFGDRLAISVIVVGTDADQVETFLRTERIRATLETMDEPVYGQQFGGTPLPAIYLLRGRRIIGWNPVTPAALLTGGDWSSSIEEMIESALVE